MAVQDQRVLDAMSIATHEAVAVVRELIEVNGLDVPDPIESIVKAGVYAGLTRLLDALGIESGRVDVSAEEAFIAVHGDDDLMSDDELDRLIRNLNGEV